MRYMILILTLVFAASAWGSCNLRSARIDGQMIAVGDSAREAFELGPDREWNLENDYGGAAGLRLDFYERGKTVEVYIKAGKVTKICHRRD